jgi:hypothetical protein
MLYPSDATSAAALTAAMADLEDISYMRTTRGAYPNAGNLTEARGAEFPGFAAGHGRYRGRDRRRPAARTVTGCGMASDVGLPRAASPVMSSYA